MNHADKTCNSMHNLTNKLIDRMHVKKSSHVRHVARQKNILNVLSGQTKNPFGLTDTELADLKAAGLYDEEEGLIEPELTSSALYGGLPESVASLYEKSDKFSGAEMEAFKEKFNLPDVGGTLGLALGLASPLLKKGSRKTRDFFTDNVLPAGKFTYKGQVVTPEMFQFLSPTEMQEVYGNYMNRRQGNEIDAYGNPIIQRDDSGPSDPCKGPNPPAYCFIGGNAPTTPDPVFTPAFRFMNRGGMVEDAPMGGIMDLETTRQMLLQHPGKIKAGD